jgi:hypothetical protein
MKYRIRKQNSTGRISALLCLVALTGLVVINACSVNDGVMVAADAPQDPPVPVNDSLLPLISGNTWHYTYRVYDSAGVQFASDENLTLSLPGVWGFVQNSILTRLNNGSWDSGFRDFSTHYFEYAWGDAARGSLIAYRTPIGRPSGYYFMGTYVGSTTQLFDSAQLWLAYPATDGFSYSFNSGASGDASAVHAMSVVSVKKPYYFPRATGVGAGVGVSFVDCYLYQETYRDTVSYYWFAKEIGCIAYQRIYNGTIRKSYILNNYMVSM